MATRAVLRRGQAPREPAGKRPRRTATNHLDPMPGPPDPRTEPEAPEETGPIRRYRVTNKHG
eukprot:4942103-Heterocapsa_arctica.AAC.1